MILTSSLSVTQNKIRDIAQLEKMILFVQSGGFFTKNCLEKHSNKDNRISPVIEITSFEDGKLFIHDGHHRATAIVLGGREFLDTTEYRIRNYSYNDYINANLSADWITPFNPLTEVRLADTSEYKHVIRNVDNDKILKSIVDYQHLYKAPRAIESLCDFAESYSKVLVR